MVAKTMKSSKSLLLSPTKESQVREPHESWLYTCITEQNPILRRRIAFT